MSQSNPKLSFKTKKMRSGTGVLLLPLYHPVRVAEAGATSDILSGGRFELGGGASVACAVRTSAMLITLFRALGARY